MTMHPVRFNISTALRLGALIAVTAAPFRPAHAADAVLPAVTVSGSYDNDIGVWDAASQGAATRESVEKRPALRPAEILENVPGMIVTQHSGDGKANQYFMRGYNLDHGTDFATWVAGMPVNMPTNAHGQGYTDLNFLIPELVSRVVYAKGPYYAQDGDFASAGSARIQYVDALPDTIAALTGGSAGYGRVLLAGSPVFGPGRLLYAFEYQHNDGPWINPNYYGKRNAVLRYAQGNEVNGFNLAAMAYSAGWNSTDQVPLRAVASGQIDRFGAIDPTDGGQASRYSISGEWRQANGNVSRAASFYVIRSTLNLFSNFTYFLDDPVHGDQFEQAERRWVFGGSLSQSWDMKWGGRTVSNTVGLQLRQDRLSPVALYATEDRLPLSVTREDRVTVASLAPYVSSTVNWTSWLRSVAGLRADFQRFKVGSSIPANSGSASAAIVSPKLSLIFGPWARTEYFINAGKGFHSNDARGTTITADPKAGAPAQRVDPLVRTTGYEAGVRTRPLPGLTATATLWRLKQASELLFAGDAGTTEPSRPSHRQGVEVLVQYVPRPWLALDFSIGVTQARFTDSDPVGDHIPGAPERVASAGLTLEDIGGWYGAVRWRYFGQRPLIEDNSVRSGSASLVNARAGRALSKRTRLQFDVFNLFDRKASDIDYYYESQLRGEAAPVADIHFHPMERRSLRLTLTTVL